MMADLRYAMRRLRATPGFTAAAVLVLALGTGANTAVFTLIDALYFKPLPIAGSDRLVRLYARRPGGGFGAGFSHAEFEQLRARMRTIAPLAAETSIAQLHVLANGSVYELGGDFVSAGYFRALNLEPQRGRFFDADAGAVISDRLCQALAACDRALGSLLHVNGVPVTIVGVAPHGFHGDDVSRHADLWLPQSLLGAAGLGCAAGVECAAIDVLVGRVAPGQTLRQVQTEAAASVVWSRAPDEHRRARRQIVADAATGAGPDERVELAPQMRLLAGLTLTLLCVACANLAGLLLARGLTRRREIALRLSIGATRARVVRQMLTEGLVLSGAGAAAGFLVSTWAVAQLAAFYNADSEGFLHNYDFRPDARVLLYVGGVAILTGLVSAMVPALQSSRQDPGAALKHGPGGEGAPRGRRLRHALVVGQVALSLALVVCTLVLAASGRTLIRGTHFDPAGVDVLRIRPELVPFAPQRADAFARAVAQRLRATPGVQSVGMMIGGEGLVWRSGGGNAVPVRVPGVDSPPMTIAAQDVDPGWFETLRVPILSGRAFADRDRGGSERVAIVNETLARRLWPVGTAVGRAIEVQNRPYHVVGVVADIQPPTATTAAAPHVYLPFWQTAAADKGDVRLAIRVAGDPAAALPRLRAAIRAIDPAVPLGEDMPMVDQMALAYAPVLLAANVTAACGVLALILSGIGLYSVLALAMRSRTRDIGIRLAIGASPGEIARDVMRHAVALGIAGAAFGVGAAWVAIRLIDAWLYGVSGAHGSAFTVGGAAVLATALAAGYLPARRAACVDPILALRAE